MCQLIVRYGADAAPYFRILNLITKGEKFDPNGIHTSKFVPELRFLPDKYFFILKLNFCSNKISSFFSI
jgi:deoxyribodipyrimidine photo-lyase